MNIKTIAGSVVAVLVLCSNAQGVTGAQINQGCVEQGRDIRCPDQMQRLRVEEPLILAVEEPRRITVGEPQRISAPEPQRISVPEPQRITVGEPQRIRGPEAGNNVPQVTSSNQKGLSQRYKDAGCVIAGEYIECPGRMHMYRQTFEIPQFGRNWQVYIPGAAYQTENTVDRTRWLHTSTGARLPNNTLNIAANGTYWWSANGKIRQGRWVQADESTLVLQNVGGVDWSATMEKLGADEKGHLVLWQGNEQLKGW